jgi:hypothetical protein
MFAALAPYKLLIECLAFAALIAAIAIGAHKFLSYEQQIGYNKAVAEYTAQALKDAQAAKAKEEVMVKQLEDARNENTLQNQRIDALASALTTTASGLRGSSDAAIRNLSSATAEAARQTATAFAGVFQDCTGRYVDLAKAADGHVADIRLLQAAP